MVPTQCIHERRVSNEPVFVYMTTKMHELIHEVDAGRRAHKQPSDVGRQQERPEHRSGYRDQDKYDQRIGREERDPPVPLVTSSFGGWDHRRHRLGLPVSRMALSRQHLSIGAIPAPYPTDDDNNKTYRKIPQNQCCLSR